MSLLSALRISARVGRNSAIYQLNGRLSAPAACLVPRKSISLSPVERKRIYGPEEAHEKIDDVHHWLHERYVAVALLPTIPIALLYPNIYTDNILVAAVVLHTYWRLSGVAEDYIHGEILPKIAQPLVKILTILALGGLFYFNYSDIGFGKAVRRLYTEL